MSLWPREELTSAAEFATDEEDLPLEPRLPVDAFAKAQSLARRAWLIHRCRKPRVNVHLGLDTRLALAVLVVVSVT